MATIEFITKEDLKQFRDDLLQDLKEALRKPKLLVPLSQFRCARRNSLLNLSEFHLVCRQEQKHVKLTSAFYVKGIENKSAEIKLFDASGRCVFQKNTVNEIAQPKILIPTFENGIYFVEILVERKIIRKKIIIAN